MLRQGSGQHVRVLQRWLSQPPCRNSSGLTKFGRSGAGRWIAIYANSGHTYVVIAGLRLDTSGSGEEGLRRRRAPRSGRGYVVRHPAGL